MIAAIYARKSKDPSPAPRRLHPEGQAGSVVAAALALTLVAHAPVAAQESELSYAQYSTALDVAGEYFATLATEFGARTRYVEILRRCGDNAEADAMHDALIAATASGEADVFVVKDHGLRRKAEQAGMRCELWTFDQLVAFAQTDKSGQEGED